MKKIKINVFGNFVVANSFDQNSLIGHGIRLTSLNPNLINPY